MKIELKQKFEICDNEIRYYLYKDNDCIASTTDLLRAESLYGLAVESASDPSRDEKVLISTEI